MLNNEDRNFAFAVIVNAAFFWKDNSSYPKFSINKMPDISIYKGRSLDSVSIRYAVGFASGRFKDTRKLIDKEAYEAFFQENTPRDLVLSPAMVDFFQKNDITHELSDYEIREIEYRHQRAKNLDEYENIQRSSKLKAYFIGIFILICIICIPIILIFGDSGGSDGRMIRYSACKDAGDLGDRWDCEEALKKAGLED